MRIQRAARDWMVSGVALGGFTAGAGAACVQFESASAGLRELFVFLTSGLPLGDGLALLLRDGPLTPPGVAAPLICDQAFSVPDLDSAPGRISPVGVLHTGGFRALRISASAGTGSLFHDEDVPGWRGARIHRETAVGLWRSLTLAPEAHTVGVVVPAPRPRTDHDL